jgi:hypothetical protein
MLYSSVSQSALCVLDRRSADTLFPAAVSAAVHAELQAVRERNVPVFL